MKVIFLVLLINNSVSRVGVILNYEYDESRQLIDEHVGDGVRRLCLSPRQYTETERVPAIAERVSESTHESVTAALQESQQGATALSPHKRGKRQSTVSHMKEGTLFHEYTTVI